ncbi:MAG TPA: winged helix-turn-helix transcriptional regulator [Bacilli bacterium]|nr:winged helix-turn-helix transcriptional regulator [Bacilli bacterium]
MDEVDGVHSLFRALGDETRLKIVYALSKGELCVCDVATIIGSSTATASHHLRTLRNHGLLKSRKEGKMVYYSIEDHCVLLLLNTALTHYNENKSI